MAGTPWPLGAEGALTAYRTAQEALTNARKHAPGLPVSLAVTYTTDAMSLKVSNPLPSAGTEGPLAHAGAGYGLTGLRERAALAGGTLTAVAGGRVGGVPRAARLTGDSLTSGSVDRRGLLRGPCARCPRAFGTMTVDYSPPWRTPLVKGCW